MSNPRRIVRLYCATAWHPEKALELLEHKVQEAIDRREIGVWITGEGKLVMSITSHVECLHDHEYIAVATVIDNATVVDNSVDNSVDNEV